MRCVAHIMNLVVSDGLKYVNNFVTCIHNAVSYVRPSLARMQKFKSCGVDTKIQNKDLIYLNVPI